MSIMTGKSAKVAALVAGGAIVGAGLGLLFAPQSGVETRRTLRRYAKKAQVEATKFGRDVKERMDQAIERSKTIIKKDEPVAVKAA
jgi:gas vesicle protein